MVVIGMIFFPGVGFIILPALGVKLVFDSTLRWVCS